MLLDEDALHRSVIVLIFAPIQPYDSYTSITTRLPKLLFAATRCPSLCACTQADGVVGAGDGLVEGVGAPVQAGAQAIQTGAQVAQTRVHAIRKRAVGVGRRVGCTAQW